MQLQPTCTAEQIEHRRAFRDHELQKLNEALANDTAHDTAFAEGLSCAVAWSRMAADSGEWEDRLKLAGLCVCQSQELARIGDDALAGAYEVEGLIVLDRLDLEGCETARNALDMVEPSCVSLHVARIASALSEPQIIMPPDDDPTFCYFVGARLCGEICREYDLQPHLVWNFMATSPDLPGDLLWSDGGRAMAVGIIVRGVSAPGHTLH